MSSRKIAQYIDQRDMNILNKHLDTPVTAGPLLSMLDFIRYSPIRNIDIIKMMHERASEIPEGLL